MIRRSNLTVVVLLLLLIGAASALVAVSRVATAQESDPRAPEGTAVISESALRQIQSLNDEKESRTPAQRKIDSQLLYASKQNQQARLTDAVDALEVNVNADERGNVAVDIKAEVTKTLLTEIDELGGEVIFSSEKFGSVRARVPLDGLEKLAASSDVKFIRPADAARTHRREELSTSKAGGAPVASPANDRSPGANPPQRGGDSRPDLGERAARALASFLTADTDARTNAGAVTTQGDATHRAAVARAAFGATGAGVRIGVLSDGVDSLAALQASGELPAVTVLPGQAGRGSEGTAMLEIVHDLAPAAQLFFATAFNGQASFAQNIIDLRAAGCDVIVDDVYYFREAVFQDDVIARAVNEVTANGALYFSSAGNDGNKNDNTSGVWEGDFVDAGTPGVGAVSFAGRVHSFGAANSNQMTADNGGNAPVGLFWSDPLGSSGNDYDLYVLNAGLTAVVGAATNFQDGNDDPVELSGISPAAGRQLVVVKKPSAAARALHLDTFGGRLIASTNGQVHGHAAAAAAFAVAASPAGPQRFGPAPNPIGPFPNPFNSGNQIELFSSDGPRRVFFNADGTPITPGNVLFNAGGGTVRQKPDITAADGVSTATPGFAVFFGTSAAAPHAAAIAALLLSYDRALSPSRVREALTATALDIEGVGADRDAGAGIVMADSALAYLAPTATPTPPPTPTPTPAPTGNYYQLVARHSGKCLDVPGAQQDNGANLIQWDCNGGANQQWQFVEVGGGYYRFAARHSGKAMDVAGASNGNAAEVLQWDYWGGVNQQWRIADVGGGFYQVTARHSGKCLDVPGAQQDNGVRLIQYDCNGGANQQWLLRPVAP